MHSKRKVAMLMAVLCTAACVFSQANAASAGTSLTYTIAEQYVLKDDLRVYPMDDSRFLLLSSDADQTVLSCFNAQNGSAQLVAVLDRRYSAAVFQQGILWLACSEMAFSDVDNSLQASTLLVRCNGANNAVQQCMAVDIFIEDSNSLAVDQNENIYMIDREDRTQIKEFSAGGAYLAAYQSRNGILTSIASSPDGARLYATYMNNGRFEAYDPGNMGHPAVLSDHAPALPYSFTDPTSILDAQGTVYSLVQDGTVLKQTYCVPSGLHTAYGDTLLTYANDGRLFLSDKTTGEATGQFTVKLDTVQSIQLSNRYVLAFGKSANGFCVQVFLTDRPEALSRSVFTQEDSAFTSFPTGNCAASLLGTDTPWKIEYDGTLLSAAERGMPRALLTNTDTGVKYERAFGSGLTVQNDTILLAPPADLPNLTRPSNHYTVHIENIYTTAGLPAAIDYQVCLTIPDNPSSNPPEQPGGITSELYLIKNGTVCGIAPSTTLAAFKHNLTCNGTLRILNQEGKQLDSGTIGTGMTVQLLQSGQVCEEIKVLVYGDLTGEGNCNTLDLRALYDSLLGKKPLSQPYLQAADCNHDGQTDTLDLLAIEKSFSGTYDILQKEWYNIQNTL